MLDRIARHLPSLEAPISPANSRILIINSSKCDEQELLCQRLADVATSTLNELRFEVMITNITVGYDIYEEAIKFEWADVVIYQHTSWLIGLSSVFLRYLEELMAVWRQDKRRLTRGMFTGKFYMTATTWVGKDDDDMHVEGVSRDIITFPLHRVNQYLGLKALPAFTASQIGDIQRYRQHLTSVFTE